MDHVIRAANTNAMIRSDDEDLRLFESWRCPGLARNIIRIKHGDSGVQSLMLHSASELNGSASIRLGSILGQNDTLKNLELRGTPGDLEAFCEGLRRNQCIQSLEFSGIHLRDTEAMESLAQFLRNNPSLKYVSLETCNLGSSGLAALSNSLADRVHDTLRRLCLGGNRIGDVGLDDLVRALTGSRHLRSLDLSGNGIGPRACASLTAMLANQESNLIVDLYLEKNSLDDESVLALAGSLTENTKLAQLCLNDNDGIAAAGWLGVLKLVCDSSSIDGVVRSNHTLRYLNSYCSTTPAALPALAHDDSNLLRASVWLNCTGDKWQVVRHKILWCHALGHLNMAESPIGMGLMPRVLDWFGNDENGSIAKLLQFRYPILTKRRSDALRLDGLFRILRSAPIMCKTADRTGPT